MSSIQANCPLCATVGGRLIWRDELLRVVHVEELGYPGFYRVIANNHVAEWTDLSAADRQRFMHVVAVGEAALRRALQPTKMNLATLGNAVPHLHWHVIARFDWDSCFPQSVWGAKQREVDSAQLLAVHAKLPAAEAQMLAALTAPAS